MQFLRLGRSRPTRAAWIETQLVNRLDGRYVSRPTRAAWIETFVVGLITLRQRVAAHTGRVD